MTTATLKKIADIIAAVEGVTATSVWEKHGKARIYIEMPKRNGGKHWNGGRAGTVFFEDGKVHHKGDWAGAATRDACLATIEKIESAIQSELAR